MLPHNFAALSDKYPQLRKALSEIGQWIAANRHLDHIDIRRVISEKPAVDPAEIAVALVVLEEEGILKGKYGLVAPTNHALTDDLFDSLEQIPKEAYDTTYRPFNTDDAEVVPIYVSAGQ
jgi:hypothetical protein